MEQKLNNSFMIFSKHDLIINANFTFDYTNLCINFQFFKDFVKTRMAIKVVST